MRRQNGRSRKKNMAKVSLRNIKKVYPNSAPKKRAKDQPEKKHNLQITDEGVVAVQEFNLDIADKELMDKILTENDIYAVIHFAGLKAVGESVQKPLEYYTNNISGTLAMCDVMRKHGVKNIIFTDIETDGALSGPSFARLEALKQVYTENIVASGGVSSNEDIRRLARMGLYGAIVGKAYYAGTVDLAQAVRDAGRQD